MDCNVASNYLKEKARMTNNCDIDCDMCPLFRNPIPCNILELKEPKVAIAIIQKWSNEHPIKTYRDDFRTKFPNCALLIDNLKWCDFYRNGIAFDNCKNLECEDCWNRPFP